MFRVVVVTLLMLLQFASPLACCCASGRFTAILGTAQKCPAKSPPACCGHHAPVDGDRRAPADRSDHERPSCPCGQSSQVAVIPADPLAAQHDLDQIASVMPAASADRSLFQSNLRPVCEPFQLPFVTADDLLHSLHILRC